MGFVDSVVLSLSATAGQFCIYTTIKEFGAVVFAACMNVRQVTNITISLVYYGHMISLGQFVGLVMVFGFLFYKVKLSKQKEDEQKKANASLRSLSRLMGSSAVLFAPETCRSCCDRRFS